jgi:putative inorganic carbon (HCO3(-)) transporter
VLIFPWLYAYLGRAKRLLSRVAAVLFIILDMVLIFMTDSVSALFCILAITVLFVLMSDHRGLTLGILLSPMILCGTLWVTYLYPISDTLQTILSRSRHFKSQLSESLWRMVWDHPAGIGMGDAAFNAVYPVYAAPDLGAVTESGSLYFELLLSYGWAGLLLFAAVLFLSVQKGLTCLRHTTERSDRAMILGGITGTVGVLIFGTVRSFITSPRVFFTVTLVLALCSAYENLIFDESDVLAACAASTPSEEDRIFRHG